MPLARDTLLAGQRGNKKKQESVSCKLISFGRVCIKIYFIFASHALFVKKEHRKGERQKRITKIDVSFSGVAIGFV